MKNQCHQHRSGLSCCFLITSQANVESFGAGSGALVFTAALSVCSQVEEKQRASVGFTKLLVAMETLGFSPSEQKAIWHVLAGIYHLGAAGACKGEPPINRSAENGNGKWNSGESRLVHFNLVTC